MSYEPIPADGAGAEKFDDRVRFYLTNQAQIDEWLLCRNEASLAIDKWLRTTVCDALTAKGAARGLGAVSTVYSGDFHAVLLHAVRTPVEKAVPSVGVGFGWHSEVNPTSNRPFATVFCSWTPTGRAAARTFSEAGGAKYASSTAGVLRDRDRWPAYKSINATSNWWTNLDKYREAILHEVLTLAAGLAVPLDAAFDVEPIGPIEEAETESYEDASGTGDGPSELEAVGETGASEARTGGPGSHPAFG